MTWPELIISEVAGGLVRPVDLQSPPNGSNDLYVVEKAGRIRILLDGEVLQEELFLDIDERVEGGNSNNSEQGLLGLAFDPDFESNGFFYLNYTHEIPTGGTETRISRFSTVVDNPRLADAASELVLLTVDQPFANHNGGQLQFGPGGFLYIGLGDGGGGGDPMNNAQNAQSLLGKMLRIDVRGDDFPEDAKRNYAIPIDNPFVGDGGVSDEIWALGLRNPWRFSFDGQTGDLYLADVGQNNWEEVNFQPAESGGENYGWRVFEGNHDFNDSLGLGPGTLTSPVREYFHSGGNCSITGGYVYRGDQYPRMSGVYFYADFCTGRIWGLAYDDAEWVFQELADTADFSLVSFGQDAQGNLYFADQSAGSIFQITDSIGVDVRDNWAGFPVIINSSGWVNTGTWMGWVQVDLAPWIWNDTLNQWLFIVEEDITENGSWIFIPKP